MTTWKVCEARAFYRASCIITSSVCVEDDRIVTLTAVVVERLTARRKVREMRPHTYLPVYLQRRLFSTHLPVHSMLHRWIAGHCSAQPPQCSA